MLNATITQPSSKIQEIQQDRPAWIPAHIEADWDDDPYAYQTEEESMPAGPAHNQLLAYMVEVIRHALKEQGLMVWMDVFMLYRRPDGVKERIAPDLLLTEYREILPRSYDLDDLPPPPCVIEITSPKSHLGDLVDKVDLYFGLGIQTYLVIDMIRPDESLRDEFEVYLWRRVGGQPVRQQAAADGSYLLPEMNLRLKVAGQQVMFSNAQTGEPLFDTSQLLGALNATRQQAEETRARLEQEAETRRRVEAETRARLEQEAAARRRDAERIAELEAEIRRLKGETE